VRILGADPLMEPAAPCHAPALALSADHGDRHGPLRKAIATSSETKRTGMDKQSQARSNPACVACGKQNSKGLRIDFVNESDGVCARWTPTHDWESFRGIIHGGIITTVLDEAMSKAVISRGWEALTAELKVRFRNRVSPGNPLQIRGWIISKRKRRILAEAKLTTNMGQEVAHAWATFLAVPGGECAEPRLSQTPIDCEIVEQNYRHAGSSRLEQPME